MFFLLPVLILVLTALALLIIIRFKPNIKLTWVFALAGTLAALLAVLLWQVQFPGSFSLPAWQPISVFKLTPTWSFDKVSWPYSISLATLASAIILTSIVRKENAPRSWLGTLILTALGLLAIAAGDPMTLILAWTAIDLAEGITMLRSTEGETQTRLVVIAFAVRIAGTGIVIWAGAINSSAYVPLSFDRIANNAGIYLLIASALRLGVLPLHLPYRSDNVVRRGFGTSLRFVSAAASLSLLARIPVKALDVALTPYLLVLTALSALYAGWMWLRASDEVVGRPFWILGLASLAVASALRGSPEGSIGWGVVMILSGGLLFLYSSRHRSVMWIPLLGLWGLSAFPFSPSASAWLAVGSSSWLFPILFLPAQALLIAGFIRHVLHPGETSFESQERWARVLYPLGLILLSAFLILLGLWGWAGAMTLGLWWVSVLVSLLAVVIVIYVFKGSSQIPAAISRWGDFLHLNPFYKTIRSIIRLLEGIVRMITSTLEGEGGIFWSFLLLVLILSLLTMGGGQ